MRPLVLSKLAQLRCRCAVWHGRNTLNPVRRPGSFIYLSPWRAVIAGCFSPCPAPILFSIMEFISHKTNQKERRRNRRFSGWAGAVVHGFSRARPQSISSREYLPLVAYIALNSRRVALALSQLLRTKGLQNQSSPTTAANSQARR